MTAYLTGVVADLPVSARGYVRFLLGELLGQEPERYDQVSLAPQLSDDDYTANCRRRLQIALALAPFVGQVLDGPGRQVGLDTGEAILAVAHEAVVTDRSAAPEALHPLCVTLKDVEQPQALGHLRDIVDGLNLLEDVVCQMIYHRYAGGAGQGALEVSSPPKKSPRPTHAVLRRRWQERLEASRFEEVRADCATLMAGRRPAGYLARLYRAAAWLLSGARLGPVLLVLIEDGVALAGRRWPQRQAAALTIALALRAGFAPRPQIDATAKALNELYRGEPVAVIAAVQVNAPLIRLLFAADAARGWAATVPPLVFPGYPAP